MQKHYDFPRRHQTNSSEIKIEDTGIKRTLSKISNRKKSSENPDQNLLSAVNVKSIIKNNKSDLKQDSPKRRKSNLQINAPPIQRKSVSIAVSENNCEEEPPRASGASDATKSFFQKNPEKLAQLQHQITMMRKRQHTQYANQLKVEAQRRKRKQQKEQRRKEKEKAQRNQRQGKSMVVLKLDKLIDSLQYFRKEFQGTREPIFLYPDKKLQQKEAMAKLNNLKDTKKRKKNKKSKMLKLKLSESSSSTSKSPLEKSPAQELKIFSPTSAIIKIENFNQSPAQTQNKGGLEVRNQKTIHEKRRESINFGAMPNFNFQKSRKQADLINISSFEEESNQSKNLILSSLAANFDSKITKKQQEDTQNQSPFSIKETDSDSSSFSSDDTSSFKTDSSGSDDKFLENPRKSIPRKALQAGQPLTSQISSIKQSSKRDKKKKKKISKGQSGGNHGFHLNIKSAQRKKSEEDSSSLSSYAMSPKTSSARRRKDFKKLDKEKIKHPPESALRRKAIPHLGDLRKQKNFSQSQFIGQSHQPKSKLTMKESEIKLDTQRSSVRNIDKQLIKTNTRTSITQKKLFDIGSPREKPDLKFEIEVIPPDSDASKSPTRQNSVNLSPSRHLEDKKGFKKQSFSPLKRINTSFKQKAQNSSKKLQPLDVIPEAESPMKIMKSPGQKEEADSLNRTNSSKSSPKGFSPKRNMRHTLFIKDSNNDLLNIQQTLRKNARKPSQQEKIEEDDDSFGTDDGMTNYNAEHTPRKKSSSSFRKIKENQVLLQPVPRRNEKSQQKFEYRNQEVNIFSQEPFSSFFSGSQNPNNLKSKYEENKVSQSPPNPHKKEQNPKIRKQKQLQKLSMLAKQVKLETTQTAQEIQKLIDNQLGSLIQNYALKIQEGQQRQKKLLSPLKKEIERNQKRRQVLTQPNSRLQSPQNSNSSYIEEIIQRNSQKKLVLPHLEHKMIYEKKTAFPSSYREKQSQINLIKKPKKQNKALEKLKKLQLYGDLQEVENFKSFTSK